MPKPKHKLKKPPVEYRRNGFKSTQAAAEVQAPKSDQAYRHKGSTDGLTHNPFAELEERK